jgi:hypothetical protein
VKFALTCLAVLLAYSNSATSEPESLSHLQAVAPRMHIEVFAEPGVTDALLRRICAETDAIWGAAGITFDWQRGRHNDHSTSTELVVTIDGDQTRAPELQHALGWIEFTRDGPSPLIHLSLATTEDLLRRSTTFGNITIAAHEMMVARGVPRP